MSVDLLEQHEQLMDRQRALLDATVEQLTALYGEPDRGRHRAVFFLPCGQKVLKAPLCDDGMLDNGREANWSSDFIPLADCQLIENELGVPLLEMERVTPTFDRDLPDWTAWVDCQQVGYTQDGRLVAFDVGC